MTLGGLALAVGILVDQSIVVLENVVRHARMGKSSAVPGPPDSTAASWVGIASGLRGGEQVVRADGGQLREGQKVAATAVGRLE